MYVVADVCLCLSNMNVNYLSIWVVSLCAEKVVETSGNQIVLFELYRHSCLQNIPEHSNLHYLYISEVEPYYWKC